MKNSINFIYMTLLAGCGATPLSYTPTINNDIPLVLKIIKKTLQEQPEDYRPKELEVTQKYMKITGYLPSGRTSELIRFKSLGVLGLHSQRDWFIVTMPNRSGFIRYRVYNKNEHRVKSFIDAIYTLKNKKSYVNFNKKMNITVFGLTLGNKFDTNNCIDLLHKEGVYIDSCSFNPPKMSKLFSNYMIDFGSFNHIVSGIYASSTSLGDIDKCEDKASALVMAIMEKYGTNPGDITRDDSGFKFILVKDNITFSYTCNETNIHETDKIVELFSVIDRKILKGIKEENILRKKEKVHKEAKDLMKEF